MKLTVNADNLNKRTTIVGNHWDIVKLLDYARIGAAHQRENNTGDMKQHNLAIAEYSEHYNELARP